MKKRYLILLALSSLLVSVLLWGCGSGPGSPGSYGCEDVGLICDVTLTPTYQDEPTYSVDVVQQICDPGPPPEYEYFADHSATAAISLRLLNPDTTRLLEPVYIEKYTIEFRRATDSIGSPPIQSDTRYRTITLTPPTGTTINTFDTTVVLVDLPRKSQYLSDVLSGRYTYGLAYINNYTASYIFEGQSMGKAIKIFGQANFQIGSFDYCD
ncbi:MAG: hypothetical protein OEW69_10445 [Nitrospirota bacterium]|nr:hypothetical protein [Nitrospirota bacterium]